MGLNRRMLGAIDHRWWQGQYIRRERVCKWRTSGDESEDCRCYAGGPVALPNAASRGTDDMMREVVVDSGWRCAVVREVMEVAIGHRHEPWRRFKI